MYPNDELLPGERATTTAAPIGMNTFSLNQCEHNFIYSHIEYPPTGIYSSIPPNKEVVVCKRCGEIRKFNIYN